MSETQIERKIFSLLDITQSVQRMFSQYYSANIWIKAEMNKLGFYAQSGHCFPELVEKNNGRVIARMDAFIRNEDFRNINAGFLRVLNEPVREGIKILLLGRLEFHPEYGLKLRIVDIDPAFSLGDLEREKQESIRRLQEENLLLLNKALPFPLLPKRIAIISDSDSRGFKDFMSVLEAAEENFGYKFFCRLYPASLQGEKALNTIPVQLNKIRKVAHYFDAVALIRGGGGELTFSCYNNYNLAKAFATFPLPVISGLGHVTNQSVVDLVANESVITPTKCAEFIVRKFHDFNAPVLAAEALFKNQLPKILAEAKNQFAAEIKLFRSIAQANMLQNKKVFDETCRTLIHESTLTFQNEKEKLEHRLNFISRESIQTIRRMSSDLVQQKNRLLVDTNVFLKSKKLETSAAEKNVLNMHPENVLKRGYSITRRYGKAVTSASQLEPGAKIETQLHDGMLHSTVDLTNESHEQKAKLHRGV